MALIASPLQEDVDGSTPSSHVSSNERNEMG